MPPVQSGPADLTILTGACLASSTTSGRALVALALRLSQTGSGWGVAGLWLAGMVPAVVLAPITGLLLDRVETVRLLRHLALAGAVLDTGLAAVPGVAWVLVLASLLGLVSATSAPGLLAIAGPLRAAPGDEARSLTRLQAAQWAGAPVGTVLGAVVVGAWGTRAPLLVDAVCLALLAVGLGALRTKRTPAPGLAGESWRRSLGAGLRLLGADPLLRRLILPVALVVAFVNVAVVVEVFLATRVFNAGPLGYGALVSSGVPDWWWGPWRCHGCPISTPSD